MSILAIFAPYIALVAAIIIMILVWRMVLRLKRRRATA